MVVVSYHLKHAAPSVCLRRTPHHYGGMPSRKRCRSMSEISAITPIFAIRSTGGAPTSHLSHRLAGHPHQTRYLGMRQIQSPHNTFQW